jgi:tetratricopeptide (TPR) repeat protein
VVRPWLTRLAAAVAAVWILALGMLTWHQVQIWRDTETLWRYAVEAEPGCSICQGGLGSAFFRLKLFPLAKEKYELALALRPDRVWVHSEIGLALQSMGDFEAAMNHHRIAVARYPKDPTLLVNMAIALLYQRRYAEAVPLLEHASRIDPNHVPTLVNLGVGLIGTGQPEKALTLLLRAVNLRPEEPMVHLNLARAYLTLGEYEAARKEYDALLKIDPERAHALDAAFFSIW